MSYKNILFDLDGTISNNFEGITNSIYHSLTYYPHIEKPERESLLPFIGPPLTVSYANRFGMDEQTAREAVDHYREYYRDQGIFELCLYDGIADLLRELSEKGYRVINADCTILVLFKHAWRTVLMQLALVVMIYSFRLVFDHFKVFC